VSPALPIDPALARLYARTAHGIRPGPDRVAALLNRLGRPQAAYHVIHVAGTNGKGSVCAMVESILRAAGVRTGLYTSPHLVRFHERIRVAGRPVGDVDVARELVVLEREAAALGEPSGAELTFFEMATALAFAHFRAAGVETAVVETGMGGRLDATSAAYPVVAVITDIDLDHVEHLGRTREAIAREKAGIVKPGSTLVHGDLPMEVAGVLAAAARETGAPRRVAPPGGRVWRTAAGLWGQDLRLRWGGDERAVRLPLPGPHQLRNVELALEAVSAWAVRCGRSVPADAVARGLETVEWPARLQLLEDDPPTLLDGAHNPHAAAALAAALQDLAAPAGIALVVGMMSDKDHAGFFSALAGGTGRAWTVPIATPRAASAAELCDRARAAGLDATPAGSIEAAIAEARAWARARGTWTVVTGSLYLAGEVLAARGGERLFGA